VLNFGARPLDYRLPGALKIERALLNNALGGAATPGAAQLKLAPWQATIYELY
jgi:hypothetical protein